MFNSENPAVDPLVKNVLLLFTILVPSVFWPESSDGRTIIKILAGLWKLAGQGQGDDPCPKIMEELQQISGGIVFQTVLENSCNRTQLST